MISSFGLLGKWRIGPAVTEIVPNGALMVLSETFLLRFVGPHDPAMQGFIKLACLHQPLTDPVVETRTRDSQRANQLGRPPFIWQESVARPSTWAWRSHAYLSLYLPDRLRPKAGSSVDRAIACIGECLSNRSGSPACLGQLLDQLADLRIGAEAHSACLLVESPRLRWSLRRSTRYAPSHAHCCPARPPRLVRRPDA